MAHASTALTPKDVAKRNPMLGKRWGEAALIILIVGLAAVAGSIGLGATKGDDFQQFFFSYLVAYSFGLSIALGALFFTILQFLTRSRWSVTIRRLAEIIAATLPLFFVLGLPIVIPMIFGNHGLYYWLDPARLAEGSATFDALVAHKQGYLNLGFFVVRYLLYFAIWSWLAWKFFRASLRQDKSGDPKISLKLQKFSTLAMPLFALSLTFFVVDFLMSVDPHWFSTIIGVYFFAGCGLGFLAFITLAAIFLHTKGLLRGIITIEHYHDLGKLMFAFTMFWGYIAFSQYMLYWYANIPEETGWYLRRQTEAWTPWSVALIFVCLFIPLAGLLSRHIKRRKRFLWFWCAWLLVAHWLDLYWLVKPELSSESVSFGVMDIVCLFGVLATMVGAMLFVAKGKPLVPLKDPALADALEFENV